MISRSDDMSKGFDYREARQVTAAMKKYGSIFANRMGKLLEKAGTVDIVKIKQTWPDLWEKYRVIAHNQLLKVEGIMIKQKEFCRNTGVPFFAPENGICWYCKRQIEDTDKIHLTGCQYCNRRFCD